MRCEPYRTVLTGWGRYPTVEGWELKSEDLPAITEKASLSRGLGRSYGDASLPADSDRVVANTTLADRLLAFDSDTGLLRAEAGLSLRALNDLLLRKGWFVPVSPGTQFVTLGGMVAADVHGKNSHVDGSFGDHLRSLKLRLADGRIVECSDRNEPELFGATIGGMGLTGHILEVQFPMRRIPTPWIWSESQRIRNVHAMIAGLKEAAAEWPMTVGWLDCLAKGAQLGRGILMKGRWAEPSQAPVAPPGFGRCVRVPWEFPRWVLSKWSMKGFNTLYYWKHFQETKCGIVDPIAFLYPLDAILDWNLIYGKRGFTQYQCVLPHADDNGPSQRFLEMFAASGAASFLCVIKDCGTQGKGMLSFTRPGISIALDIPIHPLRTQALVDRLNELVIAEGGRIYLAKDALTRVEHFRAMEPRWESWNAVRRGWDPQGKLRSALSVRLLGDAP